MTLRKKIKPLNRLIMIFSLIIPGNKEIFVFGSGSGSFADNAKYMFLEMSNESIKRPIWICSNQEVIDELNEKGYEAYHSESRKAKYYSLRAGYAVIDHVIENLPSWYILGAEIIDLWHGFPYKDIRESGNEENQISKLVKKFRYKLYLPDKFLFTSKKYEHLFGRFMEQSQSIYAGYPRNDLLLNEISGSEVASMELDQDFIFYLPTFRDNKDFAEEVDLSKIDKKLENMEINLVLKPHPKTVIQGEFENIKVLEGDIDIYPLLKQSEALITDYSSVMFDYMHTGKPVIRYQFDKEEYEKVRGLNDEVEHLIPGKEVKTIEGLKESLGNLDEIDADCEDKINEVFECRKEGLQAEHILNQID